MNSDIATVLFNEGTIEKKIRELGHQLSIDYEGKEPVVIGILNGAVVFMTDIIRNIRTSLTIDFLSLSSYGSGTKSSGIVKIRKDIDTNLENRHVIVIEDIVDTGLSLKYLLEYLNKHKPASLKTCILLDKPKAHKVDIHIDYKGFEIGNEFVVGYGLDFDEKYRNLPYIGILKKEIYS